MTWREYHELTKHSVESLRRTQHYLDYLDWANMPNPFRHYEGVPILDFPADPPAPQIFSSRSTRGQNRKYFSQGWCGIPFAVDVLFGLD
jgi:hypothetical protein